MKQSRVASLKALQGGPVPPTLPGRSNTTALTSHDYFLLNCAFGCAHMPVGKSGLARLLRRYPIVSTNNSQLLSHWQSLARQAQFSPSKLAAICGFSERHLQRFFKKQFGCPPSKWLRDLQCRLAQELISKGYSNKTVAAELGFVRDTHFCREFKKHFGVSPQAFASKKSHGNTDHCRN